VARAAASWSYWRPGSSDVVELCVVSGGGARLPMHFHNEDQLAFVFAGCRQFLLRGRLVEVGPGQGVVLPAGVPHLSVDSSPDLVSFNAYLPGGQYAAASIVRDLHWLWRRSGRVPWTDVLDVVGACRRRGPDAAATPPPAMPPPTALPPTALPPAASPPAVAPIGANAGARAQVRQLAAEAGMSREGYSRRFVRRRGMPPHAYLLVCRLNQARDLLRAGVPIATVAADCGFADQSHLGRWFRRAFGVTPGRYRRG
jgi:AraC-like DNA-binding protein